MLKRSKKSLLLAAALLMPAAAFAQEKTDAPVKEADALVELIVEAVVVDESAAKVAQEKVAEEQVAEKKGKKKKAGSVVVKGKSVGVASGVIELDENSNHMIRLIEIDGDDVPQNINLILKQLKGLEAASKGKDGTPRVMSFTIGANGALNGDSKELNAQMKEAMKMIDVSVEGMDLDVGGQVIRVLQNVKPGKAKMKMLNGKAFQIKNLTDAMANLNGTISISTSSSSSSDNGEEPQVVTNSQIRFIGPDGKVQEMKFDANGSNQQSVTKAVQEALKKSGKNLPADIQKKVQEAMKRAEARSQAIWLKNGPGKVQSVVVRDTAKPSKSIESKLDLILERLEKMQQEIDALKK